MSAELKKNIIASRPYVVFAVISSIVSLIFSGFITKDVHVLHYPMLGYDGICAIVEVYVAISIIMSVFTDFFVKLSIVSMSPIVFVSYFWIESTAIADYARLEDCANYAVYIAFVFLVGFLRKNMTFVAWINAATFASSLVVSIQWLGSEHVLK